MTSQQFLVCDSSTLANFKSWAMAISGFFTTAGWVQTADTGQVNWSTISAVPAAGAFVYEVWKPGDALTAFYCKISYGNISGSANCPSLQVQLGTGTNGAGAITGYSTGNFWTNTATYTPPSATTTYECDFSGDTGRMCIMMWRNGINNCQQLFAIERSVNAAGTYTSSYVTLYVLGVGTGTYVPNGQASILFGVGLAPGAPNGQLVVGGWFARAPTQSTAFNGMVTIDTATPSVGYYDYPGTAVGIAWGADLAEGVTFQVTLYAATRTYMPSKNGQFGQVQNTWGGKGIASNVFATLMRYD